jgi:hypothetical protein
MILVLTWRRGNYLSRPNMETMGPLLGPLLGPLCTLDLIRGL